MVVTHENLEQSLSLLREQFRGYCASIQSEFEEQISWLNGIRDGLRNGSINPQDVFLPKTPGKGEGPLELIEECPNATVNLGNVSDSSQGSSSNSQSRKKKSGKTREKKKIPSKPYIKVERPSVLEEREEEEEEPLLLMQAKLNKRLYEENSDSQSKRVCLSVASTDSGLSSSGGHNTSSSTNGVKQEYLSPRDKSSGAISNNGSGNSEGISTKGTKRGVSKFCENSAINTNNSGSSPEKPPPKRSRSACRGTYVVEEKDGRMGRTNSEPRKNSTAILSENSGAVKGLSKLNSATKHASHIKILSKENICSNKSPLLQKAPQILKGETVKQTVKAFEAFSEVCVGADKEATMLPPPRNLVAPAASVVPSLDDAINAPTRITRTKTRAMAKAAAVEEAMSSKPQDKTVTPDNLKSPDKVPSSLHKAAGEMSQESHSKQNMWPSSARLGLKPFGSAFKLNHCLKASTPLNRTNLLTANFSGNISLTAPRLNNLVTSVESFINKPTQQEVRPAKTNLQDLVAKAELASKKKEEMMKAQMEERIKKRQEKRMKVCATREAMEKEKQEMQQRLERERQEKQRLLQVEREEKLRQEALKKKRIALQKAAETEERRNQEEAARLARLKQQEEEQRRLAAERKREQEEAERKYQERLQQERELAAVRANEVERARKEAEKFAKEAALKAEKAVKAQLDQTFQVQAAASASQSYNLTPTPENRQPLPAQDPNNYGIDDICTDDSSEDESKPKKVVPAWAEKKQRISRLMYDCEISNRQLRFFYNSKKCTPDLSKIFTQIDRRQLVRKSSAVWRTPPVKHTPDY